MVGGVAVVIAAVVGSAVVGSKDSKNSKLPTHKTNYNLLLVASLLSLPQPFSAPSSSADDSSTGAKAGGWSGLGLMDDLKLGLSRASLDSPTPIQELAIPALLSSNSVAFAAATGSGKTLAYLLPVMQKLKGEELLMGSSSSDSETPASRKVKVKTARAKRQQLAIKSLQLVASLLALPT